jgi:hypothetical protein
MTTLAITYLLQGFILGAIGLGFSWLAGKINHVEHLADGTNSKLQALVETKSDLLQATMETTLARERSQADKGPQ